MSTVGVWERFLTASGLRPAAASRSLASVLFDKTLLFAVFLFCYAWSETSWSSLQYPLPRPWLSIMEALAAVSLAGNVLQFLDVATQVVKQARRYHNSIGGRLQRHIAIESSIDDLDRLLQNLRYVPLASGTGAKTVDVNIDPSLLRKAEDCIFVGDELREALSKIQVNGRRSWSNSLRKAFKSVMSETYITQLQNRLSAVQQDLQLHLSVDQREQLKSIQAGQGDILAKLDSVALSIYRNVLDGQENLLNVHQKHFSQEFQTLHQQTAQISEQISTLKVSLAEPSTHLVLSPGLSPLPSPNPTGRDLYKAIRDERVDVIPEMISQGANINYVNDKDDSRPIHVATKQGNTKVMDVLLLNGVDVECYNGHGLTPLMIAARHGVLTSVRQLLDAGCDVDAKLLASRPGVMAGIDLDNMTTSGSTALTLAAQNGHAAVVRELLSRGASVDVRSNHCFTPLHAAVQNGRPACVDALLRGGADIEAATDGGFTALIYAANVNEIECAKMLLDAKANIEAKKSLGMTAILEAIWTRNATMVELLAKSGANLEVTTGICGDRHTPLQMAAENGDTLTVAALLRCGANQEQTLNNGFTAEQNARNRSDEAVVQVFEDYRRTINS